MEWKEKCNKKNPEIVLNDNDEYDDMMNENFIIKYLGIIKGRNNCFESQ